MEESGINTTVITEKVEIPPELLEFLQNDPSFIICPQCNNCWENAGAGNEDDCRHVKTEGGKPLTTSSRQHYTQYRFRCPRCESIFCSSCKAIPYHLGFSCSEFEEAMKSLKCRWCKEPITEDHLATTGPPKDPLRMVCAGCKERESNCLEKTHECGHPAIWHNSISTRNLPDCIIPQCVEAQSDRSDRTTSEDFCAICWVEELGAQPCLKLNCGHIFHAECVKNKLKFRWPAGGPVNVSFLECPLCKVPLNWPATCQPYVKTLRELQELRADLKLRCSQQLKLEELEDETSATDEEKMFDLGMHKFNFYECFKCKSFYYGGKKECDQAANGGEEVLSKPEELICGGCKPACAIHGADQMAYKCRFCCSVATYYCFGHTHFCSDCHSKPWNIVSQNNYQFIVNKLPPCPGPDKCPLGVAHPPNGEEYVLGCGACGEFVFDTKCQVVDDPALLEQPNQ